jgi:cysteine desulfuration protein SufE
MPSPFSNNDCRFSIVELAPRISSFAIRMSKFDDIADTFQAVDDDFRLELLLDYADKLPPLPERYHKLRDEGIGMVHECQSPVFLQVETENGTLRVFADVPREAPTARAFCAILTEAFDGEPSGAVRNAPRDPLHQLGLSQLLGARRTRGLSAVYQRLQNEADEAVTGNEATPQESAAR